MGAGAMASGVGGSLSSHNSNRRRFADADRSAYSAGQALVTVVNDPRADKNQGWAGYWGFKAQDLSWQDPPPPLDPFKYPPYKRQDFEAYLRIVSGAYEAFLGDRASLADAALRQLLLTDATGEGRSVWRVAWPTAGPRGVRRWGFGAPGSGRCAGVRGHAVVRCACCVEACTAASTHTYPDIRALTSCGLAPVLRCCRAAASSVGLCRCAAHAGRRAGSGTAAGA